MKYASRSPAADRFVAQMRALPMVLAAALALGACGDPEQITLRGQGASVVVTLMPFQIEVRDAEGVAVLTTLSNGGSGSYGTPGTTIDTPHIESVLLPGWDTYQAQEGPWQRKRRADVLSYDDDSAKVELLGPDHRVRLLISINGSRVRIESSAKSLVDEEDPEGPKTRAGMSFVLPAEERFFGLGERFGTLQHRGWSFYSWAEELGVGVGESEPVAADNPYPNGPSMTGFPVPWLLSNRGYGLHIDTTYRSEVHLGSERDDAWRLAVDHHDVNLTVYVDADPLEILDAFAADTGRPVVPPDWVFGPRRRVNPYEEVDGVFELELFRQRGVPTTGVDDSNHMLPHNSHLGREQYLRDWIAAAHALGYKVMAYNTPYVSITDDAAAAEFAYGVDNGLFIETPFGSPGETWFISGQLQFLATIDLTQPAGVAWFQDLLRRSLELGYDGWMHDFGEYVQRDWVVADGRRGDEIHNLFPVLSAKAAYELMEQERPGDYLYFVRSGYTGTQQYTPAVWGSDPESTFDPSQGLPAQLRGGLNLGLSGVPYWGSDISGFKCLTEDARDKEVYLRWVQMGAVSPIMMEQDACSNPIGTRTKWTLWADEETWTVYGAAARLHTRLQPYFLVLAQQAHATGAPLMRHPFLIFPREPESWEADDSFFLGPALFAAPVVQRGVTVRHVWLPPGRYVDWQDHAVYEGGQEVSIPAPLDKLPLLLVQGHMVPLWDASIQTLAPATDPSVVSVTDVDDRLDVVVALAPGDIASLTLADGTQLEVRRADDVGNADGLIDATAVTLPDCARCYLAATSGGVQRLQLNSDATAQDTVRVEDVTASHTGNRPLRVRWDVLRLP